MTDTTHDDLVKRLRKADEYEPLGHDGWEAADRIEELEASRLFTYTQKELDEVVAAAVAAALREAAEHHMRHARGYAKIGEERDKAIHETHAQAILALITPDAQAALDRMLAAERERCAKVAESVALPMDGKIAKAQAGYMRGIIAHHIREGGE